MAFHLNGISPGNMTANLLGCGLFVSQQFAWNQQRFLLKWSYHQTIYPQYNTELLGEGIKKQWLKDYNGQTYWLSANINSFLKSNSNIDKRFDIQNLRLFNLALGYGAEGMTSAKSNPATYKDKPIPSYKQYGKFFLSPDLDLARLNTKSGIGNLGFNVLNILKTPLPALEYNTITNLSSISVLLISSFPNVSFR